MEKGMMNMNETKGKLRETFWTPYEDTKQYVDKPFRLVRALTNLEVDTECVGELFIIRFDNGEEVTAWFEEIYEKSCVVNGKLI
jgi:hypothetical protein